MEKINITPDKVFCPQPMYIIGTKNEDGQANFSVITWIGFSWNDSPHIMLCIGGTKKTKENILRDKVFSANLVSTDMVWLADYFGCTKGNEGQKDKIPYEFTWGEKVDVPIIEQSKWVFECQVSKVVELTDSHIFVSKIENIQIDKRFENMDLQMIDLMQLDPVIYAPYHYFSLGEKLGSCNEWNQHFNLSE
ncbi:flavin reductase family protein [Scatolibacter rhodanostii]|uniref:flavin reductase family protein n=1 Tax=Scatolibacter rhodanostii TaxID=2014781 RepID=UPI000C0867C9|nr:flavin reductase family protein [Scatolibacter rhodanostii]